MTLRRGGPGGSCAGSGKSGMVPTDERVEGREEEDVSGTDRSSAPDVGSLPDCGLYWKDGVMSWILELSKIEGTLLGRGGRCGGCDLPGGG